MSNPRHSHPNCDEALHLLRGTLEHSVGDEMVMMNAGDTLVVPAGVAHQAVNVGSEDADMIVAYNTGERQFQREL
ncbi:MAG: cupin domain-containing protein [Armatimonadota bacterium]|nr:MAG: cupin domain-containing protein [Armatimonadota bacterium]